MQPVLCPLLDLGTLDDIVLDILAQLDEECGISGDADQKILVVLRVYLCIHKNLRVDDVVLGVIDVQGALGLERRNSQGRQIAWPSA